MKNCLMFSIIVFCASCQNRVMNDAIAWKPGLFEDFQKQRLPSFVAITDFSLQSAALIASNKINIHYVEEKNRNLFFGKNARHIVDIVKKSERTDVWRPDMNYMLWIAYDDGTGLLFPCYWNGDEVGSSFYIKDRNQEIRSSREMEDFWVQYLATVYYPTWFLKEKNEQDVQWRPGRFEDFYQPISCITISYGPLPLGFTCSEIFANQQAVKIGEYLKNARPIEKRVEPYNLLWAEFSDKTGVVISFMFNEKDGLCYLKDSNGEIRASKEMGDFWVAYKKIDLNSRKGEPVIIPELLNK